jgi:hypothetical protein
MFKRVVALVLALAIGLAATASLADDPAARTQLCGKDGAWQQALDQAAAPQGAATAQSCADPTLIQTAGGCCEGHGGPAGCDAATHRVLCADGKKSRSCSC